MRAAKALLCGAALLALLAPGVRADDYNKLTYFTFSGAVQLPGIVLPAGTYMFKLANPESGRRAIQVWDQEGKKLQTTLLTMSEERMEQPKEPMVMFGEQPAGEPPAVRSWFYEGDRIGHEFVYPKDQAVKIAKAAHAEVLTSDTAVGDSDAWRSAKVGRVNENGQFADSSSATAANAAPADSTTASNSSASTPATAGSSSAAVAPSASTSRVDPSPSANRTEPTVPAARNAEPTAVADAGAASQQDRSSTPSSAASAGRDSRSDVADTQPVGTSGQAPASSQPAAPATPTQLPQTASSFMLLQLLSAGSLLGGLGVRQLRKRIAEL